MWVSPSALKWKDEENWEILRIKQVLFSIEAFKKFYLLHFLTQIKKYNKENNAI